MAEPFTILKGSAVPLLRNNIDTDTIAPGSQTPAKSAGAEFSERGSSTLADDLFGNWRYDTDGTPIPDFVLNRPEHQGARILVTGENFGCGSSRESAVWMLAAWGFRCVIAPSFAEIFMGNCYANGLLPMQLSQEEVSRIAAEARIGDAGEFTVDLHECELVTPSGRTVPFSISEFRRRGLLEGLDEISVTLLEAPAIDAFLQQQRRQRPWIYHTGG